MTQYTSHTHKLMMFHGPMCRIRGICIDDNAATAAAATPDPLIRFGAMCTALQIIMVLTIARKLNTNISIEWCNRDCDYTIVLCTTYSHAHITRVKCRSPTAATTSRSRTTTPNAKVIGAFVMEMLPNRKLRTHHCDRAPNVLRN